MSLFSLFLIALSLAMDAFAVSLSAELSQKTIFVRQALILAGVFGIFQAVMPWIGWVGGLSIRNYIESMDHWIIFGILGFLGAKMIYEALHDEADETRDYFSWKTLLLLGTATSIDALAVGVSFALFPINILYAVSMIGVVTAILCFAGVYLGKRFGHMLGSRAEIFGGVVLIAIGIKILVEHLFS